MRAQLRNALRRMKLPTNTTAVAGLLIAGSALTGLYGCSSEEKPAPERQDTNDQTKAGEQDDGGGDELVSYGTDAVPADGDWLMWRLPAEMPHLNPILSSDHYASLVMGFVFDRLLDRDPITLEMTPYVAESWEVSDDHLTYTFHLRDDVKFTDGEPLTAEDVKFTFDKLKDPEVDAAHLRNYFKDVTSCEVVDEYTIRFTCTKPYYRHLIMLGSIELLPKHVYSEGEFNQHPKNRDPVGSGRYTVEKWQTGQEIVLARNKNYWYEDDIDQPHFDEIHFKLIADDNAAFQVLLGGNLDYMYLTPDQWVQRTDTARFTNRFNKFTYYRPAYSYIGWNRRKAWFEDKRVRRAMTMMLDRELIRDEIYHGLARVVTGNFMPDTPAYDDSIDPWPFDPQGAEKLLNEAGWNDSDGDGIRDKDGVSFRFEVMTTSQNPIAERILTVFKEELSRHGIDMVIRQLEWASMVERVQARNFDAVTMAWAMPPDPDPYQVFHSSQAENGSNYVGFENEEADNIIEEARATFDDEKRAELYNRFHQIMHEEQPYTFLFSRMRLMSLGKRIHNVVLYPFGPDQREWFVPQDQQRYGQH